MNTNSLLNESAGFNKKMSEESKGLVSKWEPTGLLEGTSTDFERAGIATLLENQARQLVSEASATGTSANSEEWAGVALPLVRRIFSEIAAKEFVSVQPMNLPSGLVFYLDFKYVLLSQVSLLVLVKIHKATLYSVLPKLQTKLQVVFMVLVVLVTLSTMWLLLH